MRAVVAFFRDCLALFGLVVALTLFVQPLAAAVAPPSIIRIVGTDHAAKGCVIDDAEVPFCP